MNGYWAHIDSQTKAFATAKTVDDVFAILGYPDPETSTGEGFFGGDGDDMLGALYEAGWHSHRYEAPYYWVVRESNGDGLISYTEGDVGRGDNPHCGE